MKTFYSKKVLFISTVFILIIVLSLSFFFNIKHPVPGRNQTVLVDIHRGERFLAIVDTLQSKGVTRNRVSFYLLAFLKGDAHHIKAGEYEFPPGISPSAILDKLVKGDIKRYRVTIPEDLTVQEIANRLAQCGLIDPKYFLDLSKDAAFLSALGIEGDTIEGYLYPETYYFDRSMGAREIMIRMVAEFWKHITPAMKKRAQTLGFTLQEWVTLASIIGKETGYGEEKALISAVFHNRLKKGMKLQSDPTAVYNLKNFNGPIKRRHLDMASSHNTYQIEGLPPSPISNPGLDSLQAALYPATVNYLYFVSRNNGTHFFSTNYISHHQAVKKYQVNGKKE